MSIWSSPSLVLSDVPARFRLSLGEGETRVERWQMDDGVLLKREDLNPTGSHKDRAAAYQLALAAAQGNQCVVISSSGNAAIATSRYAELHDVPAVVFVHPDTDEAKLDAIDGSTTIIVVTERAINGAKLLARELRVPNLRPSTNDDAIISYSSLGDELAVQLPNNVDCVVMFATSGATAVAVADVLIKRRPGMALHVVQGEGQSGIVAPNIEITAVEARSAAAGRLGVKKSRRGRAVRTAIERSGGAGHVVSIDEISTLRGIDTSGGLILSDESAANLEVGRKLRRLGHHPCVVLSGAPAQAVQSSPEAGRPIRIKAHDEHEALERVIELLKQI